MKTNNTKMRTLYVMQILNERTDEHHILNASELCQILENEYDISADRRTIYNEVEILQNFGMDIVQVKGKRSGYYVASHLFELPELKVLVDTVQSAKFLTEKKSRELIRKLETLCSKYEADQLSRQVVIINRPKAVSEVIYINVDHIHMAIYENHKLSFQYAEWTPKKELRLKHDGAYYEVSPWALIWDDENYYMVAYDGHADTMKHYRVDKMKNLQVQDAERIGEEYYKDLNLAEFAKKTFGMFGGHDEEVILTGENPLAGVVLDRFGSDIWMHPMDDGHFTARVKVSVSRQFFGWVTGIGNGLKIQGPDTVKIEYKKYLADILENY